MKRNQTDYKREHFYVFIEFGTELIIPTIIQQSFVTKPTVGYCLFIRFVYRQTDDNV